MTQQERSIAPEIRERIFGLYWGQKILGSNDIDYQEVWNPYWYSAEDFFLSVKPLSFVTDEDANEIISIIWRNCSFHRPTNGHHIATNLPYTDLPANVSGFIYDFLRSRGYALPAFGYNIEELVQAGIFKISENEQ